MVMNEQERARIAAAVAAAEARTSVELKLALAPASSHYGAFALIHPALLALLIGCVVAVAFPGTSARAMLLLQAAGAALAYALLHIPGLRRALVPVGVKRKAARRLARLEFARLGLDTAAGRPALLLFATSAERYVEILVDARVATRVEQASFDAIVATFGAAARTGRIADAFVAATEAIAATLQGPFPAQPGDRNERSDEIDILAP
jgi:putative membrane protein